MVGRKSVRLFSNLAFRLMVLAMRVEYLFRPPARALDDVPIREGMTLVDIGCGPGFHTPFAAERVGCEGHVYAVDRHPLAIEMVRKLAAKKGLENVSGHVMTSEGCEVPDRSVDLIYGLDMLHMVLDAKTMLNEMRRIIKDDGLLMLEDGHQSRKRTLSKISRSPGWTVSEQSARFVYCRPRFE